VTHARRARSCAGRARSCAAPGAEPVQCDTLASPRSSLRPPSTVALAKGTIFLNARAFVACRFGEEAWGAIVASLPLGAREALAEIVAMGWYDASLQPAI
jgi:hypothetical protein